MDVRRSSLSAPRVVMTAVIAVVLAGTAAVAAGVGPSGTPAGWAFNGAAQPIASGVRLTSAGQPAEAGSMFWTAPIRLNDPIRIEFDASMNGGEGGADGMALVFADVARRGNPRLLGASGKALGYEGSSEIAVALDTFQNVGEPSANFVAVATGINASGSPNYIATATDVPDLRVGTHAVRVDAAPGHLDVAVDGRAVLSTNVTVPNFDFIGVSSGSGAFTDNHVVTNVRVTGATGNNLLDPNRSAPTTTTTSTSTSVVTTPPVVAPPAASSAPPRAGGYFAMLPPGSPLPTDAQCAAEVHRSSWEPRPENTAANHTVPTAPDLGTFSQWNATWNATYRPRVDGNFTGTTDEIAQWAACKWGWPDDLVRAQMVQESSWRQSTEGDREPRSQGHCVYDDASDLCPTSFSIIQVKWYFHPAVGSSTSAQSSYPWIKRSTAFALDLELSEMRGCFDGMSTYLGNTTGDIWGCIQWWYSGSWVPGGSSYAAHVLSLRNAMPWLAWPDRS